MNLLEHPELMAYFNYALPPETLSPPPNWDPDARTYTFANLNSTNGASLYRDWANPRPATPGDRFTGWYVPSEPVGEEMASLTISFGVLGEEPWSVELTSPGVGVPIYFDIDAYEPLYGNADIQVYGSQNSGLDPPAGLYAGGVIYLDEPSPPEPGVECFWTDLLSVTEDCDGGTDPEEEIVPLTLRGYKTSAGGVAFNPYWTENALLLAGPSSVALLGCYTPTLGFDTPEWTGEANIAGLTFESFGEDGIYLDQGDPGPGTDMYSSGMPEWMAPYDEWAIGVMDIDGTEYYCLFVNSSGA